MATMKNKYLNFSVISGVSCITSLFLTYLWFHSQSDQFAAQGGEGDISWVFLSFFGCLISLGFAIASIVFLVISLRK